MKRWIVFLGSVVAASAFAILADRVYSAQATKPVPATVVSKMDSYDSSGNYKRTRTKIAAVRSDGSIVEMATMTSPEGVVIDNRAIYDWPGRRKIGVHGVVKSWNAADLDPHEFDAMSGNRVACASDATRERSFYHGYEVVKDTSDYFDGEYTSESWRAPALNCMELPE